MVIQWQSSGNPVCLKLRPQCTGMILEKEVLVASVFPVCFQNTSGLPVVFRCVPIMQINTGSPLGHHWVLASASVVPVASQCTCDSSGLPVWSVHWYPSVLTESGLEVIRSGQFPALVSLINTMLMIIFSRVSLSQTSLIIILYFIYLTNTVQNWPSTNWSDW